VNIITPRRPEFTPQPPEFVRSALQFTRYRLKLTPHRPVHGIHKLPVERIDGLRQPFDGLVLFVIRYDVMRQTVSVV
jgi:hypothetical protein